MIGLMSHGNSMAVGKVRVPHEILNKEGPLTPRELAVIKQHPEWGLELLAAIEALNALKQSCSVDLHTDSNYLRNGINDWIKKMEEEWLAHRQ